MRVRFPHLAARPLTLRTTVALWLGTILLAWSALVASWFVARAWSVDTHHAVLTAGMQAADASHRLEVAILGYRRADLLWHATGRDDHRRQRDEYLKTAKETAADFARYANTPEEKAREVRIQEFLTALEGQVGVASAAPPEAEVQLSEEVLAAVRDFRQEKQTQMEDSIAATDRLFRVITYWMVGLSAGTAALLLAGALRFVYRVMRPVLLLTRRAEAFGRGDLTTRAPVLYNDELGTLARTFNNMAADISRREQERVRFVAMVAHDLKNPVYAIELALRALRKPQVSDQDRQSYAGGALEETARLKRIVRDVTDNAQVATGRFSLARTDVDLGVLVRRLMEGQKEARATHEIVVETPAGCVIQGDAERLERVVMNLFSNAIKYSPPHTRVTVRVETKGDSAVLSVSDEGRGIAKEDLSVIFQPFGRGRSAGALAEGAGMGLYVVKRIVEAHQGRIEVRSEPGRGTTFRVELPLARMPQPA
jgi:signal transduction histidine kinase